MKLLINYIFFLQLLFLTSNRWDNCNIQSRRINCHFYFINKFDKHFTKGIWQYFYDTKVSCILESKAEDSAKIWQDENVAKTHMHFKTDAVARDFEWLKDFMGELIP